MKSQGVVLSSIVGLVLPLMAAALPQGMDSNPKGGERLCHQVRGGPDAQCWGSPSTDLGTPLVVSPSFEPETGDPIGSVYTCYFKASGSDCLKGDCYWYYSRDSECWMSGHWLDKECNPNDHTRSPIQQCSKPAPEPTSPAPSSTPRASKTTSKHSTRKTTSKPSASKTPYPSSSTTTELPAPTYTSETPTAPSSYPTLSAEPTSKPSASETSYPSSPSAYEPSYPTSASEAPTAPPPYPTLSSEPTTPTGTSACAGTGTGALPTTQPTSYPTSAPPPPFEGAANRATGSIACLVLSGLGLLASWL